MQKTESIKPLLLNCDVGYEELKPHESPFIKGVTFDIGANPVSIIGTNNPTGEGQNQLVQKTIRSNTEVPDVLLPTGYNKHIGSFYSDVTQELYHFNYNVNAKHGIYVLSGNTGLWQKVIEDAELQFTDNQENYIADHRVLLRFIRDRNGNIIEKYLLITEGGSWQKYINVGAAIKTNGFDTSLYPYWNLRPPHFDRRELVEWPVRPPMIMPEWSVIANTDADKGKINRFVDKGLQVAYLFQNTDGRISNTSPYSLPILIKSEDFLNNPDNITKNVKLKLYAGSPLTEKILIYVRTAKKGVNTLPSISEWGDWYLYDTINKFPKSTSTDVLGTDYWLRTNPWSAYEYDNLFNTVSYVFDLSKTQQIVPDQEQANSLFTGMPQISIGLTDLGDAALLVDNRYGYPNFGDDVMDHLSAEAVEKEQESCDIPLRKIRLYAIVGRMGDDFNYISQVGYYMGDDKQMRFGGLKPIIDNQALSFELDVNESKFFELDFADKNAFRCYFKGTPYYADGEWYKVDANNNLTKLDELLDFTNLAVWEDAVQHLKESGNFVCVFDLVAPADRYIATIGRHNVASDGDYRNTSTYIYGIANSRTKSDGVHIKPDAVTDTNGLLYSKEMEIDCTNGDVDVWGNNHDLFYIFCPHIHSTGHDNYRMIEGYLQESADTLRPIELFPYTLHGGYIIGHFTDKNGFYWGYTQVRESDEKVIEIIAKVNCAYPYQFGIPSTGGIGWKKNPVHYLDTHIDDADMPANRILIFGRITSLDGTQNYSNIAVSIKDGSTAYTNSFGVFTLVTHSGLPTPRVSNIYLNAGGNFLITIADCGHVPLFNFNEALVPCYYPVPDGTNRSYPIGINLAVKVSTDRQTSLKEGGKYSVTIHGADLAGRLMFENIIEDITVPSFTQRGNTNATFFRVNIGNVNLVNYPDIKWVAFSVSKNIGIKRFVEWIGDSVTFIDNNGKSVRDAASAVFASIKINSLYSTNISKNFSLLSTYEFVKGDRIRILDNGEGTLFDAATYGDLDFQIEGTNYSQAAISSGLLPTSNTVPQTEASKDVELIVRYDNRLNVLLDKKGFWIEIYTPTEQSDIIPFYEVTSFYPVINGRIAVFAGYDTNGQRNYVYPAEIDLQFWDTYFYSRSITIPNIGNRFLSHIFQSPNVTDTWGADITSGGRPWVKNDNARQYWLPGEAAKSDNFLKEGVLNGLAIFRPGNKKDFGSFPHGGIVAVHSERNIIVFVCENDWLTTDYNFHRAFLNEQGILVANLDDGISAPHQKIGSLLGMAKVDTGTFIAYDKNVYWYDRRNADYIKCNYRDAVSVTIKSDSEQGGMQSYFGAKTDYVTVWNNAHAKQKSFDVIAGVDPLGKIYVTFRPRRNNSNESHSYINDRRNWQLDFQETVVYDTTNSAWIRSAEFTPEGYGRIKGDAIGTQMVTFAAGKPYYHDKEKNSFNKFYGVQCTPVYCGVFNQDKIEKVLDGIFHSGNPTGWFIDMIFSDFKNGFTYLSSNQFKKYLNNYYAAVMRNMNSYPTNNPDELFRSMLFCGYRTLGKYFVFRMVGDYAHLNEYKEIGVLSGVQTMEDSNKK